MGALLLLVFQIFVLSGKQAHLTFFWRPGGQAAENRWRRSVEATKRLCSYTPQQRRKTGLRAGHWWRGKVGGPFHGAPLLLLPITTYETRTGRRRARSARSAVFVVDERALFNRGTREIRPRLRLAATEDIVVDDIVVIA